jgi:hypothetical protein
MAQKTASPATACPESPLEVLTIPAPAEPVQRPTPYPGTQDEVVSRCWEIRHVPQVSVRRGLLACLEGVMHLHQGERVGPAGAGMAQRSLWRWSSVEPG